jgi:hypothetical protein
MRLPLSVAAALAAVALAAASLAGAPAATARESFVPWNWCGSHATTDALRLRAAPSTGSSGTVLGLLDRSDRLRTDAATGGWVHVTLRGRSARGIADGTTGWVAARYLAPRQCTRFD